MFMFIMKMNHYREHEDHEDEDHEIMRMMRIMMQMMMHDGNMGDDQDRDEVVQQQF